MDSNKTIGRAPRFGRWRLSQKDSLLVILPLVLLLPVLVACGNDNPTAVSTTAASTNVAASNTTAANSTTVAAASTTTVASQPLAAITTAPAANTSNAVATGNLEVDVINVVDQVKAGVVLISVTSSQGSGVGTGSIITPDGYIVTNFHVVALGGTTVAPQSQVVVVLNDGKKYPAKIVGAIASNDLAVIKIEDTNLPTVKMGSSGALKIGEWVVAIGNALGLPGGPTVTTGIVGAKGRSIEEPSGAQLVDLVQTNAQINPGNSGGPLLNLKGEIVGINTAAPVDPENGTAAQGIGFALSMDQTKPIIDDLISGKGYSPPYLGILPQAVTPGLAARYNLPSDSGVLITQIVPDSPAAKAGWTANAILTELDGTSISDLSDLQKVLLKHKPGDTVQAKLLTPDGQQKTAPITFGAAPNS